MNRLFERKISLIMRKNAWDHLKATISHLIDELIKLVMSFVRATRRPRRREEIRLQATQRKMTCKKLDTNLESNVSQRVLTSWLKCNLNYSFFFQQERNYKKTTKRWWRLEDIFENPINAMSELQEEEGEKQICNLLTSQSSLSKWTNGCLGRLHNKIRII